MEKTELTEDVKVLEGDARKIEDAWEASDYIGIGSAGFILIITIVMLIKKYTITGDKQRKLP